MIARRYRVVPNVLSGWAAHGVTLIVGFVMPRLIDESIGQAALGVWDLAWSLLNYLAFSGFGMAAAITTDVAKFSTDSREAASSIATASVCQIALAVLLGTLFLLLFFALPGWAGGAFEENARAVYWIGSCLGVAVAITILGDVAQGVLTGYHRSSWNEYITIAADVSLALAMVLVLLSGGGIIGLAVVTLLVRAVSEAVRIVLALRVVPEGGVDFRLWSSSRARSLGRYMVKSSLALMQELLIHQTARVFLATTAGPSALAVYSRYQTLVRQVARFMERSLRIIPPITSDLSARNRPEDVARLRARTSRVAALLACPLLVSFAVFGDQLVLVWMGPQFVQPEIAWVLAAMALLQVDYSVSSRVLAGLNVHGRIAAICFLSSTSSFALLWLLLQPLDVVSTAWLVALSLGAGGALPHYFLSCARLETPPWAFFRQVYALPLAANGLLLLGLIGSRALMMEGSHGFAALGAATSFAVLAVLYWQFGFEPNVRTTLFHRLKDSLQPSR